MTKLFGTDYNAINCKNDITAADVEEFEDLYSEMMKFLNNFQQQDLSFKVKDSSR